jgi:hypothetical protein
VKIYVLVVKALREKERGDETQFTTKMGGKTSLGPNYFIVYGIFQNTNYTVGLW